ncbi:hypothetical protein SATMO3_40690 [Sporomusa aerivorans]
MLKDYGFLTSVRVNMNRYRRLAGYYYAIKNYLHTPKGRFDMLDYVRAAAVIAGVIIVSGFIMAVLRV